MVKAGETPADGSRYIATDMLVYPNSLMIGWPDHVEFWTIWPVLGSPGKCTVNIRFLVRPEILSEKIEERINRSWEILENAATNEDFPMELSMQKNIASAPESVFRYGKGEISARHLHEQLRRDIDGEG